MADNVDITPGTGATIAADEVTRNATSEKQQIVKLALGAEGAFDNLVDAGQQVSAASIPFVGASDWTQICGGDLAHDAPDSSSRSIKTGGKAIAHGTNPTAVAAGDRTDLYANRHGIPFVIAAHPNVQTVRLQFTAAQTNVAIVSVSAGMKIAVTALQVTLDNASTVFPSVRIGFGTATTPTTTGVIAAHGGVPAGGGFSRGDGSGILGVGADDEDLRITTVGAATGNGVEVVVTYFTIES